MLIVVIYVEPILHGDGIGNRNISVFNPQKWRIKPFNGSWMHVRPFGG